MWQALFGDLATEEDHDTLAKACPDVFRYVRWHWLESVTLELAKLGDRDSMGGRQNLTLRRIFDETTFTADAEERDARRAMDLALGEIEQDAFKKVRNRVIAHNDLLATTGVETPLSALDIEAVRKAVQSVKNFRVRIAAVRSGKPINVASGDGFVAGDDPRWLRAAERLVSLLKAGLGSEPAGG